MPTTPAAPTKVDVLIEACAAAGLHLAQVRGTGMELVARRDLDALSRMLFEAWHA